MQFINNGPDIPNSLIQEHEEGRVVFFCGAGISYPAGLPSFKKLVENVYEALAVIPNAVQRAAIKAGQFDTAIGLLEADIVGGRETVRRELVGILTPDLSAPNATATHDALLTLGKCCDGQIRLITTNFDRLFEEVVAAKSLPIESFKAPLLPVPKNRWDGLVYLHGLIGAAQTASELDRLVISSGDFGLAYLTERWAARFVSELFRNYTICFIGYSINDPVLRYMMDALAADRLLGESPPEMFAFGSFPKGKEEERANEWRAKNVTPILYREHNRHAYLHKTLRAWAETYRDGVQGKEAVVVKYALTRPQESTQQDNFVGRMLWALTDKSGLPAKRFADFNPAPSLDWLLEAFSDKCFQHGDLARFGVPPLDEVDTKLRFSLVHRPTPYDLAPAMLLASGGVPGSQLDLVMSYLARWLVRHLDDPRLVIWIVERGGQLHDSWRLLIEQELDHLASLEREGRNAELDEIRLQAPKAIPGPLMRILWRLLLSGRVKSSRLGPDLYRWKGRLKREGLTTTLRLELREILAPKVTLKKAFRLSDEEDGTANPTRLRQLVDWELVLSTDHVHSALQDLADEHWTPVLPLLLDDFHQLLCDALDLLRELGEADEHGDRSHLDLPSITPHWQNRGFRDWVSLIELLRDAWLAVYANDRHRATRIAQNWFELPYPTFKRLALFAASQDDCISPEDWVNWLLTDGAWWLWSRDTGREVFRLFVLQGRYLAGAEQQRLDATILVGPPREMYRDDLEEDRWRGLVAHSVWLHLSKLSSSGHTLSVPAAARLVEISTTYPQWQLVTNERDEFSHWMSATGDPDFEDIRKVDIAPRKRQDLVQWLTKPIQEQWPFYEDTWREVCRTRFFHSFSALCDLAQDDVWPASRWSVALQAWSEKDIVLRSWRYAAPLVQAMPDAVLQEIDHAATWWIEAASKSINNHEDILLSLCRHVLALPLEAGSGSRIIQNGVETYDPVGSAINHPVGHVTQALINLWFKRNPNDNDLLPADLKPTFTVLCDVHVDRFLHGRVLMCSRLIAFFRVDQEWTTQHLLPLFDWQRSEKEARAAWEGFLWSSRLYQPLLTAFKSHFLDTANHYAELGEHRQQFAAFLTYAALGPTEGYTIDEFRFAIGALPLDGLEESAKTLSQALKGAADQCEEYWKNRVRPFVQRIWPKSRDRITPRISEYFALLCISARNEFPDAIDLLKDWLTPVSPISIVVPVLHESGLCGRFPEYALRLVRAVISDQQWLPQELSLCLDEIEHSLPQLAQDGRYLRLQELLRERGSQ